MRYFLILISSFFIIACNESENPIEDRPIDDLSEDLIDSLAFLSENINNDSKNAFHWGNRANYFYRLGNIGDAKRDFEEAILRDSTNANYRVKYADILVVYLDLQGAKYNYEYALKVDSLNARAYVGMGHIYALIDNPGMATVYLNKAYKINQNLPEAYYLEGLIYQADFEQTQREESWKRSKSSFQTATELKPDFFNAFLALGEMNAMEDNDLALDYFTSAIEIKPKSTQAWYAKGGYYQNHEKYEQAKYCYRKIVGIDSLYFNAFYNQGYIQLTIDKDYDSSIYFFEKSVSIDSLSAKGFNNLGLAHEYNGNKKMAVKYYKKAIEIDPEFELAKKNLSIVSKT